MIIPMARTVRDTNLETRAARERLASRGKPYFRSIEQGCHVGYRKGKKAKAGKWVVRVLLGYDKYRVETIGDADDMTDADGVRVLNWRQAQDKAREQCTEEAHKAAGIKSAGPYTVAEAIADYMEDYSSRGKSVADTQWRIDAFILPKFGNKEIAELDTRTIRGWHRALAKQPARLRSAKGQPVRYREATGDPDETRRRKSSANRVLTILKAALNHAWEEGRVESDDAWRRVKPFPKVDTARVRYLSRDECIRLVNGCDEGFKDLVQGALHTGARYGELAAFQVVDYNPDTGKLYVRESKSGKGRYIVLTDEGQAFFESITAGRPADRRIFLHGDDKPWGKAHQHRPLSAACERAGIAPAANFHSLRHTYSSHSVMAGVPLQVLAENLGHTDTRMVEKHYGHMAPSYVDDAIRSAVPTLGIETNETVVRHKPSANWSNRRG